MRGWSAEQLEALDVPENLHERLDTELVSYGNTLRPQQRTELFHTFHELGSDQLQWIWHTIIEQQQQTSWTKTNDHPPLYTYGTKLLRLRAYLTQRRVRSSSFLMEMASCFLIHLPHLAHVEAWIKSSSNSDIEVFVRTWIQPWVPDVHKSTLVAVFFFSHNATSSLNLTQVTAWIATHLTADERESWHTFFKLLPSASVHAWLHILVHPAYLSNPQTQRLAVLRRCQAGTGMADLDIVPRLFHGSLEATGTATLTQLTDRMILHQEEPMPPALFTLLNNMSACCPLRLCVDLFIHVPKDEVLVRFLTASIGHVEPTLLCGFIDHAILVSLNFSHVVDLLVVDDDPDLGMMIKPDDEEFMLVKIQPLVLTYLTGDHSRDSCHQSLVCFHRMIISEDKTRSNGLQDLEWFLRLMARSQLSPLESQNLMRCFLTCGHDVRDHWITRVQTLGVQEQQEQMHFITTLATPDEVKLYLHEILMLSSQELRRQWLEVLSIDDSESSPRRRLTNFLALFEIIAETKPPRPRTSTEDHLNETTQFHKRLLYFVSQMPQFLRFEFLHKCLVPQNLGLNLELVAYLDHVSSLNQERVQALLIRLGDVSTRQHLIHVLEKRRIKEQEQLMALLYVLPVSQGTVVIELMHSQWDLFQVHCCMDLCMILPTDHYRLLLLSFLSQMSQVDQDRMLRICKGLNATSGIFVLNFLQLLQNATPKVESLVIDEHEASNDDPVIDHWSHFFDIVFLDEELKTEPLPTRLRNTIDAFLTLVEVRQAPLPEDYQRLVFAIEISLQWSSLDIQRKGFDILRHIPDVTTRAIFLQLIHELADSSDHTISENLILYLYHSRVEFRLQMILFLSHACPEDRAMVYEVLYPLSPELKSSFCYVLMRYCTQQSHIYGNESAQNPDLRRLVSVFRDKIPREHWTLFLDQMENPVEPPALAPILLERILPQVHDVQEAQAFVTLVYSLSDVRISGLVLTTCQTLVEVNQEEQRNHQSSIVRLMTRVCMKCEGQDGISVMIRFLQRLGKPKAQLDALELLFLYPRIRLMLKAMMLLDAHEARSVVATMSLKSTEERKTLERFMREWKPESSELNWHDQQVFIAAVQAQVVAVMQPRKRPPPACGSSFSLDPSPPVIREVGAPRTDVCLHVEDTISCPQPCRRRSVNVSGQMRLTQKNYTFSPVVVKEKSPRPTNATTPSAKEEKKKNTNENLSSVHETTLPTLVGVPKPKELIKATETGCPLRADDNPGNVMSVHSDVKHIPLTSSKSCPVLPRPKQKHRRKNQPTFEESMMLLHLHEEAMSAANDVGLRKARQYRGLRSLVSPTHGLSNVEEEIIAQLARPNFQLELTKVPNRVQASKSSNAIEKVQQARIDRTVGKRFEMIPTPKMSNTPGRSYQLAQEKIIESKTSRARVAQYFGAAK